MAIADVSGRTLPGEMRLAHGRVMGIDPGGCVRVRLGDAKWADLICDVLHAGAESPTRVQVGDSVLVACRDEAADAGVILGVVGPVMVDPTRPAEGPQAADVPSSPPGEPYRIQHHEIVIEAGKELTLKCGEASIRITRDGKIVIRGENILSRAKGTQRIKGGSVAIN